jgi:ATP-dependent DNA ligase
MLKMQKTQHLRDALKLKQPKLFGDYMISVKKNGWFVYISYDAHTQFWEAPRSSANRIIPSMAWTAISVLQQLPKPKHNCYLIAEAMIPDTPFHTLNGIFNRSVGEHSCHDVVFECHDLVELDKPRVAHERYVRLQELLSNTNDRFSVLPLILVSPYEHRLWMHTFEQQVNNGEEGIVAKRALSNYLMGKRNSDLLKLKMECEVDTLAVRLEESIGEKGYPSLTLVSQRKNGTEIRTVIGSHLLQEQFRTKPETVIGKVVTVKGMEELENGQIVQPVFQHIRYEKLPGDIQ